MQDENFRAVLSITKSVREIIDKYEESVGHKPKQILLSPVIYDSWRAELIVTGWLLPLDPLTHFDGIPVEPCEGVTSARLR